MRTLQLGDHLISWRNGYYHHGIYAGRRDVIHFSGVQDDKTTASIRLGSISEFTDAIGRVQIVEYNEASCFDREHVVRRARSQLGASDYNLFNRNCEHFARWCKNGDARSEQIYRFTTATVGAAGGVGASVAAVSLVAAASAPYLCGAAQTMSGLKAITGGAYSGIGALALVPTGIGAWAANAVWRDDPYLGGAERQARANARRAGTTAAGVGWVAAMVLVSALGTRGRSAAGITSGLSRVGCGSMERGLLLLALLPTASALVAGKAAHHRSHRLSVR